LRIFMILLKRKVARKYLTLGEIGDADRFSTYKKLIAFAGLDPVVSQSGRFENKSGKISKRGSPLLRKALFLAANVARQNDENLKRFYDKKIGEGKHYYSALNAVAAKLLRITYWVLKNNKEYQTQVSLLKVWMVVILCNQRGTG
jgi:transposase